MEAAQPKSLSPQILRWCVLCVVSIAIGIVISLVLYKSLVDEKGDWARELYEIGGALGDYVVKHKEFPPAAVIGKNRQPLYSWRVLPLPHLNEEKLYSQFRLDEPWDSPHNIQFVARIPDAFAAPPSRRSRVPPGHTRFHILYNRSAQFKQPPAGTEYYWYEHLLIVEGGELEPWSKPDRYFGPADPLPDLNGFYSDGIRLMPVGNGPIFLKHDRSRQWLRDWQAWDPDSGTAPPESLRLSR